MEREKRWNADSVETYNIRVSSQQERNSAKTAQRRAGIDMAICDSSGNGTSKSSQCIGGRKDMGEYARNPWPGRGVSFQNEKGERGRRPPSQGVVIQTLDR